MKRILLVMLALACCSLSPTRLRFMLAASQGDLPLVERMLPNARKASVEMALNVAAMEDSHKVVEHLLHVQGYHRPNHFAHIKVLQIVADFDSPRTLHLLLDGRVQYSRGELLDALEWCDADDLLCREMLQKAIGEL